jgi:hypothetical protein
MRACDDRFNVGLLLGRQRQVLREPIHDPFMMRRRAMLAPRRPLPMQEQGVYNGAAERSSAEEDDEPAP